MRKLNLNIALIMWLLLASVEGIAAPAELVWIEFKEGVSNIRFAQYENDEWNVFPEPILKSNKPLTSLAMGTNEKGRKILIWTEQNRAKTALMSMTASVDDAGRLIWSLPNIFSDYGQDNFSASIVYDQLGQAWVFWAASTSNYSDVVVSRLVAGSWSEPEQVNSSNEVPDNLPVASLTQNGSVRVAWRSFDLLSNDYVSRVRDFPVGNNLDNNLDNKVQFRLVDTFSETDIPLPSEISSDSRALLHFPNNQMMQSVKIEGDL